MMTRWKALLAALWVALAAGGCAVQNGVSIQATGSFAATPPGPCAILQVTATPVPEAKTMRTTYGRVGMGNPEERFAELLAHVAAQHAGMAVMDQTTVAARLKEAGMSDRLQPPPESLPLRAQTLGCASYLTAHVERWTYRYIFFRGQSTVQYSVACHRAEDGATLWEAHACRRSSGLSDRELGLASLRQTFEHLQKALPDISSGPCP